MKLLKHKKFIGTVLLTAIMLVIAPLASPVQAAVKSIPVEFLGGDTNLAVVAGIATEVVIKLPAGGTHAAAVPPFVVLKNGSPVQDSGLIEYSKPVGAQKNGRFVAKPQAVDGGTIETPYTIKGRFYATIAEGEALEKWDALKVDNPNIPEHTPIEIESAGTGIFTSAVGTEKSGITVDSRITIVCTDGEEFGSSKFPNFIVEPGSATGNLTVYDSVSTNEVKMEGNTKVVNITLYKAGSSERLNLNIYPRQRHKGFTGRWIRSNPDETDPTKFEWEAEFDSERANLIATTTSYDINFAMPTSNDLILRVVTPQMMTNEIAINIGDPATRLDYVKLQSGDTLEWITKNFTLVTKTTSYGAEAKITWKWIWDGGTGADGAVETVGGTEKIPTGKITPQIEDTTGKLVATVTYQNEIAGEGKSLSRVIPIVIRGKGKPPYLETKTKTIGEALPESILSNDIKKLPGEMDVFDGKVKGDGIEPPHYPYTVSTVVHMGENNAAAEYMIIRSSDEAAVELRLDTDILPYKWGEKIENPAPKGSGSVDLLINAKTGAKNTTLTIEFYARQKGPNAELYYTLPSNNIAVYDTTPSRDATLKTFTIRSDDDKMKDFPLDFGFRPDKSIYSLDMPFAGLSAEVSFALNEHKATAEVLLDGVAPGSPPGSLDKLNGTNLHIDKLELGRTRVVTIKTKAHDPSSTQVYVLNITRMPANKDSSLKSLKIFSDASTSAPDLLKGFLPAKLSYDIEVPYGVKKVRVEAESTSRWVTDISIIPKPTRDMFFSKTEWINLGHIDDTDSNKKNPTEIETTVIAEDGNSKTTYAVGVTRLDPSENNMLSMMELKDKLGNPLPYNENKVFANITRDYYINIPFSTEEVRLVVKPEHEYAEKVTLAYGGKTPIEKKYDQKNKVPIEYRGLKIPVVEYPDTFVFSVFATAESGRPKTAADAIEPYYMYTIEFTRNPADSDTRLENLLLTDQDNKAVEEFTFNKETAEYDIEVPYVTSAVNVTPTAQSKLSSVTVNTQLITENRKYLTVPLTAGKKSVITVEVTAENGDRKAYILNVTRGMPSTEARLDALSVPEGTNFAPRFIPSTAAYTVTLPEGIKEYTVLATTVDPNATIAINKKAAVSGVAFGPIKSVDEKSTVTITVTAQDGKTKKVYTIAITDDNFVIKGDNSDLANLRVENGEMSPRFRPSIEDYEVYLKDETDWITILPKPIDRNSTVEVMAGSKKLGDYYGNYSTAVIDDTMDITITVKAPSPTAKTKVYNVTVMRKNEEKQGNLKPITEEMVNYEQESPIIVDVSKYHIVAAGVINKMKDYPDKSIIFKGNDCSWEMRGKDLKKLVPNTEKFDFAMSFSTPDEDFIWDILDEESRNDDLEPVYVYFNQHGTLPAPMKFTLSLGREYQNDTLYWNYYNGERDRIDYYGNVKTNVKGTFSVMLTHMSTYFSTEKRVIGAENKEGEPTSNSGGAISSYMDEPKTNPDTGGGGAR